MDPLSQAASITALVGIGLQSLKFIYDFVHAVHDAPSHIKTLASKVDKLRQALVQIAELLSLSEQDQDPPFKELRPALQSCTFALRNIQLKLQKFNASDKKGLRRAWCAVKSALGSKEFEDASDTICSHTQNLNLQLEIVGSRFSFAQGQQIRGVKGTLESIRDIASTDLAERRTGFEAFRVQTEEFQNRVSGSQEQQLEEIRSAAALLNTKLDALPELSRQLHEINRRFQEIQPYSHPPGSISGPSHAPLTSESTERVCTSTTTECPPQKSSSVDQFRTLPEEDEESRYSPLNDSDSVFNQKLAKCIDNICNLASKEPGLVGFQEAESMIDGLDYILKVFERQDRSSTSTQKRGAKRKTEDLEPPNMTNVAVKRIRKVLAPSQNINIGQSVAHPWTGLVRGLTTNQGTARLCEIQGATVIISHLTKRPRSVASPVPEDVEDSIDADGEKIIEEFKGTITLHLPNSYHSKKINIAFCQRVTSWGSSILAPAISFHCIIPMNSKVFDVVAEGSVQELLELLQGRGGNATLWDCDPNGRSLLNYALENLNVQTCEFLIEHHADVNSMEPDFLTVDGSSQFISPPLNQLPCNDCETEPEKLRRSIECRKLLLEAGADPTLFTYEVDGESNISMFENALNVGTTDTLRTFLESASHYLDLEARLSSGRTAFMVAIQPMNTYQWQFSLEKAILLLNYGAKIDTQDHWNTGCFHGLFRPISQFWLIWEEYEQLYQNTDAIRVDEVLRFLVLLLDRGGDAFTTNPTQFYSTDCCDGHSGCHHYSGYSVTERAFQIGLGKTWLRALETCSHHYDLSEFLAEDHARCCNEEATRSQDSLRKNTRESQQNGSVTQSRFSESTPDDPASCSTIVTLELPSCPHHGCDWVVWEYLESLSNRPDPNGGPDLVRWGLNNRTPDLFLRYNLPDFMYTKLQAWRRRRHSEAEDVEYSEEEADEELEGNTTDSAGEPVEQEPLPDEALHTHGNPTWEAASPVPFYATPAAYYSLADQAVQQQPAAEAASTHLSLLEPMDGCIPCVSSSADPSEEESGANGILGGMVWSSGLYEDPSLCFNPWSSDA